MTTFHPSPLAAAGLLPALRLAWLTAVPALAVLRARLSDPRMIGAALFGGAAAALLPAAMFDLGMSMIVGHDPGGAGGHGLFSAGLLAMLVVAIGAGAATLIRRRADEGRPLPLRPVAVLFALYYAAAIAPYHSEAADALMPGVAGAADPLAMIAPVHGLAPWLIALAAGGIVLMAFGPRGKE